MRVSVFGGNGFRGNGFMNGHGGCGIDISTGSARIYNLYSHHNAWGGKTSVGARTLIMNNARIEFNIHHGWTHTGEAPNLVWEFDNYYAAYNGGWGLRIPGGNYKRINFGEIIAINNAQGFYDGQEWGGNFLLSGSGHQETLTIRKLIAKEQAQVDGANYSVRLEDVIVNDIEIVNNRLDENSVGLRLAGDVLIQSGVVANNRRAGILLEKNANVQLFNIKFGDTRTS
jgi:hypothetical protein